WGIWVLLLPVRIAVILPLWILVLFFVACGGPIFYGASWLFVRAWRLLVVVVGPIMRKASDLAMAPYDRAERGYMKLLPGSLGKPWLVLGLAAAAFAVTLLTIPMLGADLIPQLAQDRFEMTVKLPPGTPLSRTDDVVRDLQQAHAKDEGIRALY